jgi:hypothetical protein
VVEFEWFEWQLNQILYVDDTALAADENLQLQRLVIEVVRVSERRKLSMNLQRARLCMRVTRKENVDLDITLNGIRMESEWKKLTIFGIYQWILIETVA